MSEFHSLQENLMNSVKEKGSVSRYRKKEERVSTNLHQSSIIVSHLYTASESLSSSDQGPPGPAEDISCSESWGKIRATNQLGNAQTISVQLSKCAFLVNLF